MKKRIVIYLRGYSRAIVLTDDSNEKDDNLKEDLQKLLLGSKFGILSTNKDILIIKPADVVGIHIQYEDKINKDNMIYDLSEIDKIMDKNETNKSESDILDNKKEDDLKIELEEDLEDNVKIELEEDLEEDELNIDDLNVEE